MRTLRSLIPLLALAALLTMGAGAAHGERGEPRLTPVASWSTTTVGTFTDAALLARPGGRVLVVKPGPRGGLFAYGPRGRLEWRVARADIYEYDVLFGNAGGVSGSVAPVVGPDGRVYLVGPQRTEVLSPAGRRIAAYPQPQDAGSAVTRVVRLLDGSLRVAASGPAAGHVLVSPAVAQARADGTVAPAPGFTATRAAGLAYRRVSCRGGTQGNCLEAVSLATGGLLWTRPALGQILAADDGGVFVRDSGRFVAYRRDGATRWSVPSRNVWPIVAGAGLLVTSSGDIRVAETGRLIRHVPGPRVRASAASLPRAVISGRTLYTWSPTTFRSFRITYAPASGAQ